MRRDVELLCFLIVDNVEAAVPTGGRLLRFGFFARGGAEAEAEPVLHGIGGRVCVGLCFATSDDGGDDDENDDAGGGGDDEVAGGSDSR